MYYTHSIVILLLLTLACACSPLEKATQGQWRELSAAKAGQGDSLRLQPDSYRLVRLSASAMQQGLESAGFSQEEGVTVWLPQPESGVEVFTVWKNNTVSPELVAKYPSLQTYEGQGQERRITVRLEFGAKGLQAMVTAPERVWYIAPYSKEKHHYMVFTKENLPGGSRLFEGR